MNRTILLQLKEWKESNNRKPLILRGARQVGKSWVVNELAAKYYAGQVHVINFEKRTDWKAIFDRNLEPKRILSDLEILLNKSIDLTSDLLFFDEIQECPNAIKVLRYFYEEMPELHVIAAGSLLEFALSEISFPVGRVRMLNMYPMSFSEYLNAIGSEPLAKMLKQTPKELSPVINDKIKEELKKYFFVGGMPESVKTYVETGSMKAVEQIQIDIIETYKQDFSKYSPKVDSTCLNDVLSSVAENVGQQIKYTQLSQGFTGPTNKKAFEVLRTARLIHSVRSASPAGLPLSAHINTKQFKAIFLDIGLLVRQSGLSIAREYQKEQLLTIYKGALAEQFVGQELLATGQTALYYWSRNAKSSNAEVDYLIPHQGNIIPIEVKNSAVGRLRSLHLLLKAYPNCTHGLVLSDARYGALPDQKLKFMPLYWARMMLDE